MKRTILGLLLSFAALSPLGAQQPAARTPQSETPTPIFKSSVGAVLVDFRVVDRQGQFVDDLTAADVKVFEDGVEQQISTFSLVNIPIRPNPIEAESSERPGPDTASNNDADGRLYLIALDDVHINALRSETVRQLARMFITRYMEPNDRAALIATSGRYAMALEFTGNHTRLLAAVDKFTGGFGAFDVADAKSNKTAVRSTFEYLQHLAKWLGGVDGRRKSIVFISEGFTANIPAGRAYRGSVDASRSASPSDGDTTSLSNADDGFFDVPGQSVFDELTSLTDDALDFQDAVTAAARANVSIYTIDPRGNSSAPSPDVRIVNLDGDEPFAPRRVAGQQLLYSLAAETGGTALLRSNDFRRGFERIVRDSSSYYLLGYSSTHPPTKKKVFHRIEVRAVRPGLRIRARSGYVGQSSNEKPETLPRGFTPKLASLIRSPAPTPGLGLHVTASTFRAEAAKHLVEVVVEADNVTTSPGEPDAGSVTIALVAVEPGGEVKATAFAKFDPIDRSAPAGAAPRAARMVSRLPLAPGSYSLRVAGTTDGGAEGSVLYDLEVPNLRKGAIAMSGVVVSSRLTASILTGGPDRSWRDARRNPPTTTRRFSPQDELAAFVEVYDNRKRAEPPIDMLVAVDDERGTRLVSKREPLATTSSSDGRHAFQATVPLAGVKPGRYVLIVRAEAAEAAVARRIPVEIVDAAR